MTKFCFDLKKEYKGNLPWLYNRTIFLTVAGSYAYGTNIKGSDVDVRGVCVPPKEIVLGFNQNFEQTDQIDPDLVIYGLRKFMFLAANCNPNIIELLFTDPKFHLIKTDVGQKLLDHRHLFLSTKAKHTFSGYAISQLKRMKTHRAWLLDPPKKAPLRADFGLEEGKKVSSSVQGAFNSLLEKGASFDSKVMQLLDREKKYNTAVNHWKQYQNWKKTRNPERAELEAKHGYDCYTEDTEFLTKEGFKLFNNITEKDLLATVFLGESYSNLKRRHLGIEYQKPIERFDGTFNGNLYHFKGYHLDMCVTPNHRMLIREFSRKNQTYKKETNFTTAADLGDSFQFLISPQPKKTSQNIVSEQQKHLPNEFKFNNLLQLMGWYLSDGCMTFSPTKKPKEIRISQKKFGKLSWHMQRFFGSYKDKISCTIREDVRKPSEFCPYSIIERTLIISEKSIVKYIFNSCGHKEAKHIPKWVYDLSKRQMDILLMALYRGDGTKRIHKTKEESIIYYSTNKNLADQVQILALMCGYETSLYGPFPYEYQDRICSMFHVHIRKINKRFKTYMRNNVINKIPVKNQRIVCFSVPNGTLITRRNGHIAIQGNCKHATHLVRLMRMCREIITTGKVEVLRPDAQELIAIRNGAWSYEQLINWAEIQDKELEELYKTCDILPHQPDRKKLNKLCIELVEELL